MVSNSISHFCEGTYYLVQQLGIASSFQENEPEQYYMQTYFLYPVL